LNSNQKLNRQAPFSVPVGVFERPETAEGLLRAITDGLPPTHLQFVPRLLEETARYPMPDELLLRFERLTRSVINKPSFCRMLSDFPPMVARLARLFASSPFLGEILIHDFQFTYFLISPEQSCPPIERAPLRKEFQGVVSLRETTVNRRLDLLRMVRRRELLKIGIRDYILGEPLHVITRSVSVLADEIVEAVYRLQYRVLCERHGEPDTSFTVLALGKLGGEELNYSSDIDLMFVYGEEGTIEHNGRRTYHEFFNELAGLILSTLSAQTREGILYRTDARLRPDGDSGPLARCLASYLHYYESRGQLWERQMLIKARVAAGDPALGKALLAQLTSFVYPRTFFDSPLREIARMKWRIEEEKARPGALNVKTDRGGIRDIEFVTQALQLVNGGTCPELRTPTTLEGLERLHRHGFLTTQEYDTLCQAYVFYRRVEHVLQIEADRQTHSIPRSGSSVRRLVFLLDLSSPEEFFSKLDRSIEKVRQLFDSIFQPAEQQSSPTVEGILMANSLSDNGTQLLEGLGFEVPQNAHRALRSLCYGQFPHPHRNTEQEAFREVLPFLLPLITETPDPDHTIVNLQRCLGGHPFPEALYKLMASSQLLRESLVLLASYSNAVTNLFCEKPSYLDFLNSHLARWRSGDAPLPSEQRGLHSHLCHLKQMEFVRLALQDAWGIKPAEAVERELTRLADFVVREVFGRFFRGEVPILLVGMGKLGGEELSYRSDLDVIFLCEDGSDVDCWIALAKQFMADVAQVTPHGRLYEIDARLRPEGPQAPLVVTICRYREYLSGRAMFWERQAMVKARPVAGRDDLAHRLMATCQEMVYEPGLRPSDAAAIVEMRERQIAEKAGRQDDVLHEFKYARGGLVEIEYAVQALQIRHGRDWPERPGQTLASLNKLLEHGHLDQSQADTLRSNYLFLRMLEKHLFLLFERRSNRLPDDEKQLAFLAKFCKLKTKADLLDTLAAVKEQNHAIFSSIIRTLRHG
jgi:glutamate-ammonia-ligase adenylyltransferase